MDALIYHCKINEWYDCILAQGRDDATVKTRLLTLLSKYKSNTKLIYEKLLKLTESKDLGSKDFKLSRDDIIDGIYADKVSNVSPKILNPLVKVITNKSVESLKQKRGLSTTSMYIICYYMFV